MLLVKNRFFLPVLKIFLVGCVVSDSQVSLSAEPDLELRSTEWSIDKADPIGSVLAERKMVGLRSAVTAALNNSPALAATTFSKSSAGYAREAVEWQRFPRFSVNFLPNFFSANGVGAARSVLVEQPIWAGGRIDGQISVAQSQELSAVYAESEMRRKLIEQVAVSYIGLMRAEERVLIVDAGVELFNGLVGYVERRNQAGASSSSDVEFAQSRLAQITVMKQQTRADLERIRTEFQAITVGDYDKAAPLVLPDYLPGSEADLVASFLEVSPLFAQSKVEIESSLANLQIKRAGIFPTVSIRIEHVNTPLAGGTVIEDTRMGLTLQYVPEAGLASISLIKEAESKIDAAKSEMKKREIDITASAKTALSDFASSAMQVKILEQQAAALQRSARSFLRQFDSGKKTWIDVLNINRELVEVKINLSKALMAKEQSQIRLMVNTGVFHDWLEKLSS